MAIFTAIAGAIGAISTFIGGLGAVGSFLLKTAVSIGMNLLAQATAGKPKDPTFSINGTLQAGGDIPRSFILGKTATAGSLVWVNTWGSDGDTPNAYLTQVIALSDLPCQSLDEVWVNGEKVTLLTGSAHAEYGVPVSEYRKGGKDYLWVKFYDGTQTTVDNFLNSKASNANRAWSSNRVGKGVCYAIVTARVTKNLFSGIPSFKFVLTGLPLYDPSKDSTVPGGSGSHRWNNPATWGGDGDHNPAVQIYNLLRGIEYDGQWFYGLQGMTAARLPTVNWIAQINKCRAGNTYRAGGEIPVEAPMATAIEALLTACQGRVSEVGGVYTIYVGEPDAAVASFHDDDILSTEEQSFTPFFGLADTINGIAATYPSPEDGWAEKAAPPLYRTDLEALAGNRRLMADVALNFVPYPEQVQRLMKSALLEGQRARRHTLVLPPEFWPYAVPGAILSWTSERNGYVNKLFRVDGAVDRANLDVMIDITEVDPADYDWDPSTDYREPVDGAVGVLRPAPQPLVGWQVFPATIGQPGKELPSIRVSYPGNLDDIRAVRVQVRLVGETAPMFDGEVPYGDPDTNENPASVVLSGSFAPDTDYQVRGVLVPVGDRETDWSEWLSVTTPNVWVADVYPVDLDRLADDIRGWQEWAGNGLREIERRLEEYDLWMADQDFGNAYDRQKLRQQITATYDQSKAEWTYEVNVVALANAALAVRTEALEATVNDPATGLAATASAVDGLEAYAGPEGALANAVTSLSAATTPGEVNEANFRMEAVSGPTGYSRIGLQTRQGGAGSWRGAAAYLDTPNNPAEKTRFAVVADQMVVMDGNGDVSAVFDGDTAYFDNARIRNLDADNIDVDALTATAGFFDNVYIDSSLQLGPNTIVAGTIAAGTMILSAVSPVFSIPAWTSGNTITIGSLSLESETGNPIDWSINMNYMQEYVEPMLMTEGSYNYVEVFLEIGGNEYPVSRNVKYPQYGRDATANVVINMVGSVSYTYIPPSPGTYTATLRMRRSMIWSVPSAASGTMQLFAKCNRR